jgi:hypothetical protein
LRTELLPPRSISLRVPLHRGRVIEMNHEHESLQISLRFCRHHRSDRTILNRKLRCGRVFARILIEVVHCHRISVVIHCDQIDEFIVVHVLDCHDAMTIKI